MEKTILNKLVIMSRLTIGAICIIGLCINMMHAESTDAQSIRDTYIEMNIKNVSLARLFDVIEEQTEFQFVYPASLTSDTEILFSYDYESVSVADLLINVSGQTGLWFCQINSSIAVNTKNMWVGTKTDEIIAPRKMAAGSITGTVRDAETGKPLPGASVFIKGTTTGDATDSEGVFLINNVEIGNHILIVTFVGYRQLEQPVSVLSDGILSVNFNLQPSYSELDKLMVIGYGRVQKKDLTGSVSTVSPEDLEPVMATTLDGALSGLASGVYVRQGSGRPGGSDISIQIRGITSLITGNAPLYVIDGVPVIVGQEFGSTYGGETIERTNPLAAIPVSDIESISVLKGASASAIYGSRASNGVVIVTTKTGEQNQTPQVRVGYSYHLQMPIDSYNMMNAAQYREAMIMAAQNTAPGASPLRDQILNNPESFFGGANTDWQEKMLRNAGGHNVNFNVAGGTVNSTYAISGSFLDQKGVVRNTGFKRYNIGANIDTYLNELIKVGTNINYSLSDRRLTVGGSNANILGYATFRPDLRAFDQDGNITVYDNVIAPSVYLDNEGKNRTQSLFGNVFGQIDLGDHLYFKTSLNVGLYSGNGSYFTRPMPVSFASDGRLETSDVTNLSTTFDNTLHYQQEFGGRHQIDAVAGASWYKVRDEYETVGYRGFTFWQELRNVTAAERTIFHEGGEAVSGLASYFARFNYNYDQRYFMTLTSRADGSSKFGPNNKWGFFPSAAVAWNISNEEFMSNSTAIDNLKIRASLGRTGSSNVPDFLFDLYFEPGNPYADQNGLVPATVPNEDIKWQSTVQFDAAIDFSLFDYRLSGSVGYFSKYVSDMLSYRVLPYNTGQATQLANVGEISNRGIEMNVSVQIVRDSDFNWEMSFNLTHLQNKIEDLHGAVLNPFGFVTNEEELEGERYSPMFGYVVDGIFQSQDEIDALNAESPTGFYQGPDTSPGDYKMRDLNGDGVINTEDQDILGYSEPNYFGGITSRFQYKSLELSFLFQFALGHSKNWNAGQYLLHMGGSSSSIPPGSNMLASAAGKSWSAENPDAKYPALAFDAPSLNTAASSRFIHKADYLRLKYVQLGYTFPGSWTQNIGISSIQATITAANFWTLTSYPGLDPESSRTRPNGLSVGNDGTYPMYKGISFGIDIRL